MDLFETLRPSENATLWRFMELFKFIDLITSKELTLVNLTLMKDPFEGILHSDIKIQMVDLEGKPVERDVSEVSRFLNHSTRQTFYISCWHENEFESAGMWDIYGNQNGIAIKTSVHKLKNAIKYNDYAEIDLLKINYFTGLDDYFIPNRKAPHAYTPLINKRISFDHEKEVRLIWHPRDYEDKSPVRKIPVNLEELIEGIYVSPLFDEWQLKAIKRLIEKLDLNIVVEKSELYELR